MRSWAPNEAARRRTWGGPADSSKARALLTKFTVPRLPRLFSRLIVACATTSLAETENSWAEGEIHGTYSCHRPLGLGSSPLFPSEKGARLTQKFWPAPLGGESGSPGVQPDSPGVQPHCKLKGAGFSGPYGLCRICSPLSARPQVGESVLLKAARVAGVNKSGTASPATWPAPNFLTGSPKGSRAPQGGSRGAGAGSPSVN